MEKVFRFIVRSKRDADAVKAVITRFYDNWNIDVVTLHGARSIEDVSERLRGLLASDKYNIVLLGREDRRVVEALEDRVPVNTVVHMVPRARIRNTRLEHLYHEIEVARSKIRLRVTWLREDKVYSLTSIGDKLEAYDYNPAYDIFLGIGEWFKKHVEKIIRGPIGSNPLIVRGMGGRHYIYSGRKLYAELLVPDEGLEPKGSLIGTTDPLDVSLEDLIRVNTDVIRVHEQISLSILEYFKDKVDVVLVPWSGGKDSTAALLLAVKVFGRDRVRPVYVDTGVDFPWIKPYLDRIAKRLGINYNVEYAGIDREIIENRREMPSHNNRWCTMLKIEAVHRFIRRHKGSRKLLVLGDRDTESERRSKRPVVRVEDEETITVAPLKMWSTMHVQLYLLMNNVELNPLYEHGFYRLGCYICPALRSWELNIMVNDPEVNKSIRSLPLYKYFIELRRKSKNLS